MVKILAKSGKVLRIGCSEERTERSSRSRQYGTAIESEKTEMKSEKLEIQDFGWALLLSNPEGTR